MSQLFGNRTIRNHLLLIGLQAFIDEWRDKFDHSPETKLKFAIDCTGMLFLNGIALCPASQIDSPESLSCDCEVFTLKTNGGDAFEIYIEWPYEGAPYLSRITRLQDIFVCTGQ